MRRWWTQFCSLAALAALETIRQPICLLLATTCIVLTSLLPVLIAYNLNEGPRLVRDSALALHFVTGLLFGSYAACSSLVHEMRAGTAGTVLSKPVSRATFFLAKFCGIAAVLLFFSLGVSLATLLGTRAAMDEVFIDWWVEGPLLLAAPLAYLSAAERNFRQRRPFVSNAFVLLVAYLAVVFVVTSLVDRRGQFVPFGQPLPWTVAGASALVALALLLLAAVAVALATRLQTVPTLSVCSMVFLLGLMSDYLFGRHAADSGLAAALYALVPNLQHFWAADAITDQAGVPWSYVFDAARYAGLYIAGVLALGLLSFRRMEVH